MRPASRLIPSTALLVLACLERNAFVSQDIPIETSRVAVIVNPKGATPEGTGLIPIADARSLTLPQVISDDIPLLVAAYRDETLALIQLPEVEALEQTPIRLEPDTNAPLPGPDWVGIGRMGPGLVELETSQEAWVLTASWAPRCARTACELFEFETEPTKIWLSGRDRREWMVPTDARKNAVFIGTQSTLFRVAPLEAIESRTSTLSPEGGSAVLTSAGEVAVLDVVPGRVLLGDPWGAMRALGSPYAAGLTGRLFGSSSGPLELYHVSSQGALRAWTGETWEILRQPIDSLGFDVEGSHLGPREFVVSLEVPGIVVRYVDGVEREQWQLPGVRTVGHDRSGEIYAVTRNGHLWRLTPGELPVDLELDRPVGYASISELNFDDVLIAGVGGDLSVFSPRLGVCTLPRFETDKIAAVQELEQGLMVLAHRNEEESSDNYVHFYPRRDASPPECPR